MRQAEGGWPSGDLEHDWALLFGVDGDVGARHPGVGAKVPESHVGVSEEESKESFTPDIHLG